MADEFDLTGLGEELTDNEVRMIAQKLAMQALNGVVMKSPVKSGRFRGNWHASVDGPDGSVSEAVDKSGDATIAKGVATIETANSYQAIWIENNLPYGPALEGGHSQQAPVGMVAVTMAELETQFSRG
ncbi:HK97 gp10 family phage protein [Ensifer sp. MPMI2T]|nr:HK97 gp10 family phage protein [Ensifer sp. MPMI2T]